MLRCSRRTGALKLTGQPPGEPCKLSPTLYPTRLVNAMPPSRPHSGNLARSGVRPLLAESGGQSQAAQSLYGR